jgi:hypothetical protein
VIVAGHQQITSEWWDARDDWRLFISPLVLREAGGGDAEAATRRLTFAQGLPVLPITDAAQTLAAGLLAGAALPAKAAEDALHIAIASVHGMEYLLTWNCRHIANASKRLMISTLCEQQGYRPPIICTPEELLGENHVD